MMKDLHLISIGKNKDNNFLHLEEKYLKRLEGLKLHLHECIGHREDITKEVQELKKKVIQIERKFGPLNIFIVTEHGKLLSSEEFSEKILNTVTYTQKGICFLIGGSLGFTKDFLKESNFNLSLGKMIFPHRMARLILIEQIYRMNCILKGHPYHKS